LRPGEVRLVDLERKVTEKNDLLAAEIRTRLKAAGVYSINLLSAPGSGKTSLLERTIPELRRHRAVRGPQAAGSCKVSRGEAGSGEAGLADPPGMPRILVVEGDLMTQNDAQRVARLGVPSVQIQTRGSCHLDSRMVQRALEGFLLEDFDLLFVENVGNLVCPTGFDLGEDVKVVVGSVTEGADKPAKYPYIFERAAAVVLNKIDLLPHVDFDVTEFTETVRRLNPGAPVFFLSCRSGEGLDPWCRWILERMEVATGPETAPGRSGH